jgi:hypothetical protein
LPPDPPPELDPLLDPLLEPLLELPLEPPPPLLELPLLPVAEHVVALVTCHSAGVDSGAQAAWLVCACKHT